MVQSTKTEAHLLSAEDTVLIQEQLQKLLAHPLFANSKRYPAFLAYVVGKTLQGVGAEVKERSIGVDVFGREPSYDANSDPVVRITAGEVRKRLTQYYYDASHAGEPVIELPVGSYQPLFHLRHATAEEVLPALPALSGETALVEAEPAAQRNLAAKSPWKLFGAGALLALLAGTAGLGVGYFYRHPPHPGIVERFWSPFTSGNGTVTFCLGEPAQSLDPNAVNSLDTPPPPAASVPLSFRLHYSGNLALADVITLARTSPALETKHQAYRVLPASRASFAQLREGPIVLVGAFDNLWTVRLTQKLRYGFESRDGKAVIVDRKNPGAPVWATAWDLPDEKLSRDYAIVARYRDSITGQPVIVAAGISEEGTEAAGEILYSEQYLQSLLARLPANWEHGNMEAVLQTQVIDGNPGPPQVLAVESW
jgi:hypothetical protein